MAKEQSFDIVSQVDMQEVDNAIQQTVKEIVQRFDLKDTKSTVELDKHEATITIKAPGDFVVKQIVDIVGSKLFKRGIDLKAVQWGTAETASGGTVRQVGTIVNGIEADLARRINKEIREGKHKVKVQIEGDKLRVFSASRDELQTVIAYVKGEDYGIPVQFVNYR
ncbi:MAG: YajQ family cyclic di-GMP-binding protein [Coriobacteriia bacterium]|nr:YajQ family cyclic di-GMP-binding protein [Coriobacteriia bacterium]